MLLSTSTSQLQGKLQTQGERVENDFPSKCIQRRVGIAVLTSDKIDFKIITVTRHRYGHFIMIKGDNTSRKYNTYQNICPQSESTKMYKATTNRPKGRN